MVIRNMQRSDIEFAYHCTAAEGWAGETEEVLGGFLSYNPEGCFIGEADGRKVGICVATRYRSNGFIGDLIVRKEMRGRGFGARLFAHAIDYLKFCGIENVFLDADLEPVPFYEKYGFRKITRSLRFEGVVPGKASPLVSRIVPNDLSKICRLDNRLFGDDRGFFLRRRFGLFPGLCWISKLGDSVTGYIFGRPGVDVVSVGPFAVVSEPIEPEELLETLAAAAGDVPLRIGVLESNSGAVEFFRSNSSLEEKEPCWRMGLGSFQGLGAADELYAVGSGAKG